MYEDPNNIPSPREPEPPEEDRSPSPAPAAEYGKEKKKKGMTAGKIVALALVCALLGGCLGAGGMMLATRGARAEEPMRESVEALPSVEPEIAAPPAETEPTAAPAAEKHQEEAAVSAFSAGTDALDFSGAALSAGDVYERNVNSTVGIRTSITGTNYWGYQTTSAASGSGFILSADGYILTNYHVVKDSSSIIVTTYDDRSFEASIVGYDESNDIAVLKIEAEDLAPVTLGDSDSLRVGDTVVAIGNPLGELTFSLTQGIVSALGREVTFSSGTTMALIQTDCAINSGNSGGALFNMYGEVVGITNAKYSSSSSSASVDNIGFAIPINHVKNIVESIIEYGYIVRPYIGVQVSTVTEELTNYGIPQGAAIRVISEDSPAEATGLQVNDVITAVDGREITSSGDLVKIVSETKPGDVLTLSVYRQGEEELLQIAITVGEQKQDANPPAEESSQQTPEGDPRDYYGANPFDGFPFGFGFGSWG